MSSSKTPVGQKASQLRALYASTLDVFIITKEASIDIRRHLSRFI